MDQTPAATWHPVGDVLCASPQTPFWSALEERLYWLDVPTRRAWRLHLPTQQAENWSLSSPSTSLVPCRSGGFLLFQPDGIYHAKAWRDVPRLLAPWPASSAPGFWQAGHCDPWGRLWLTGPAPQDQAHSSNGAALYCLHPRSAKAPLLAWVRNGMGDGLSLSWASNGQRLYWCNPSSGEVTQAALTQPSLWPPQLGLAMPWARFALRPPEPSGASAAATRAFVGLPRALILDQNEHGWLALHGTGHLMRIDGQGQASPQGKVPALCPTGLCLGGLDGRTLFVTTARAGRSAAELERYPLSGAVFAASVDSPGATPTAYWD